MKKSRYLTTTLPYVNAEPHIGFALELVQADIIARYRRLAGDDVFFNTGTDEHGQKIAQKAKEEGRQVQEYADHFAGEFKKLRSALNLSYDAFIRTTDASHVSAAQELWRLCDKAGDIYKKKLTLSTENVQIIRRWTSLRLKKRTISSNSPNTRNRWKNI
jgi:methionyl-tRNA synthetase